MYNITPRNIIALPNPTKIPEKQQSSCSTDTLGSEFLERNGEIESLAVAVARGRSSRFPSSFESAASILRDRYRRVRTIRILDFSTGYKLVPNPSNFPNRLPQKLRKFGLCLHGKSANPIVKLLHYERFLEIFNEKNLIFIPVNQA